MRRIIRDRNNLKMYLLYVQGWNNDLPDNHTMIKEFNRKKIEIARNLLSLETISKKDIAKATGLSLKQMKFYRNCTA